MMSETDFEQQMVVFERISRRKADLLEQNGGVVVGCVVVYDDVRRCVLDGEHMTWHPHQITGPQLEDPYKPPTGRKPFSDNERKQLEQWGRYTKGRAERLTTEHRAAIAGYVVLMPDRRRCVIDCSLASWHNGPINGPLQTRNDGGL